ncbi:hypothetical protein GCM10027059_13840 [Myceligenerans halotolerans]
MTDEDFLRRHLSLIERADWETLATRYHEDAVLIRPDRTFTGRRAIQRMFAESYSDSPRLLDLYVHIEDADVVLYHAEQAIGPRQFTAVGTMVLRDGLVWRQTAVVLPTAGSGEKEL